MNEVTVMLPAFNEDGAIGKLIDELKECGWTILVGDNSSTDRTYDVCIGRGITPLRFQKKGKGGTVQGLIEHVSTPIVVMMDSDYTYPVRDAYRAVEELISGKYDVVIGYRKYKERRAMTRLNILGNRLLSVLASVLYGRKVQDVCSGLWVFRADVLKAFDLTSAKFTLEADLFVNTATKGCKLGQIPISYRARLNGSKSKLIVGDGLKIGWFLIRRRFHGLAK